MNTHRALVAAVAVLLLLLGLGLQPILVLILAGGALVVWSQQHDL